MNLENLDENQKELFVLLMNNLTGEEFKRVSELIANVVIEHHQQELNQLSLDSVVESACSDYEEGINMHCSKCDQSMHLHK